MADVVTRDPRARRSAYSPCTASETPDSPGGLGGRILAGGPGGSAVAPPGLPLTTTMAQSRPFLIPAGAQLGYRLAGVLAGRQCNRVSSASREYKWPLVTMTAGPHTRNP
jgi:hypothetical protein